MGDLHKVMRAEGVGPSECVKMCRHANPAMRTDRKLSPLALPAVLLVNIPWRQLFTCVRMHGISQRGLSHSTSASLADLVPPITTTTTPPPPTLRVKVLSQPTCLFGHVLVALWHHNALAFRLLRTWGLGLRGRTAKQSRHLLTSF